MKIRYAAERGKTQTPWLESYHTFSFGDYHDSQFMGFGALRVINDDRVIPNAGFPPHSHRDMEIISYVLEGKLQHKDSLGNGSIIIPGDVQCMSAGTGITHSEFNPVAENLHFLQIWIIPDREGYTPRYKQRYFSNENKSGNFCLIASNDGRENSVFVRQNIALYAGLFSSLDAAVHYIVPEDSQAWIQIAKGNIMVNNQLLHQGDGAACNSNEVLIFEKGNNAEVLLFNLS